MRVRFDYTFLNPTHHIPHQREKPHDTRVKNTVQYNTIQYNTMQQYSTTQYNMILAETLPVSPPSSTREPHTTHTINTPPTTEHNFTIYPAPPAPAPAPRLFWSSSLSCRVCLKQKNRREASVSTAKPPTRPVLEAGSGRGSWVTGWPGVTCRSPEEGATAGRGGGGGVPLRRGRPRRWPRCTQTGYRCTREGSSTARCGWGLREGGRRGDGRKGGRVLSAKRSSEIMERGRNVVQSPLRGASKIGSVCRCADLFFFLGVCVWYRTLEGC